MVLKIKIKGKKMANQYKKEEETNSTDDELVIDIQNDGSDDSDSEVCDYEQQRLQNIAERRESFELLKVC